MTDTQTCEIKDCTKPPVAMVRVGESVSLYLCYDHCERAMARFLCDEGNDGKYLSMARVK